MFGYFEAIIVSDEFIIEPRHFFDKTLPTLCYYFYYRFARSLLDMNKNYPKLEVWIKYLEYILITYLLFDLFSKLFEINLYASEIIFNTGAIGIFIATLILIYIFIKEKNTLSNFLVFGAVIAALSSIATMLLIIREQNGLSNLINPFLPFVIGTVIELLAFTSGLAYKSRTEELEKNKTQNLLIAELQTNLRLNQENQEIRKNVINEIHLEIGQNISDINIYAALAKKVNDGSSRERNEYLSNIKKISFDVLSNIQDLTWSIFPENTKLPILIDKIEQICNVVLIPSKVKFEMLKTELVETQNISLKFSRNTLNLFRCICNQVALSGCNSILLSISSESIELIIQGESKKLIEIEQIIKQFEGKLELKTQVQDSAIRVKLLIPKISY